MPIETEQKKDSRWVIFPDEIGDEFLGFATKKDTSRKSMRLQVVAGQNTIIENGSLTVRKGSKLVGAAGSGAAIANQFCHTRRDGVNILLRHYGTIVEWKHPDVDVWDTLITGLTSGYRMGFASQNINADGVSYCFMCNSEEEMKRWSSVYAKLASVTGSTIVVGGSTTLANLGFTATGSVVMDGITYAYTGLSSQTFTGVTPDPTLGGHVTDEPLAQIPLSVSAAPRGNILLVDNSRLLIAGVRRDSVGTLAPKQSSLYGSKIDDATNYTITSPRTAGQAFIIDNPDIYDVNGLARDAKAIYIIGTGGVKTLRFIESTTSSMDDFPVAEPLKSFDGKSRATGGISPLAIAAGANGLYFVTQNKEIAFLEQAADDSSPQIRRVSDPISPTLKAGVFTSAAMIVHDNKLRLSFKSDDEVTFNDVEITFDEERSAWNPPSVGRQISAYASVGSELHWGSSLNNSSFKETEDRLDSAVGFSANGKFWLENFDNPHLEKEVDMLFIEGFIRENTELKVNLYWDEDGFTTMRTGTITGTTDGILFSNDIYNPFGLHPFGLQVVGSNPVVNDLKKFRIYFGMKPNISFYNLQVEFLSDDETDLNYIWEITRFGVRLSRSSMPIKDKYKKKMV